MHKIALTLLLALALALPATAGEDTATPAAKVELGKQAPEITMKDVEGRTFQLHDCKITPKEAEALVMAAAKGFGAPDGATAKTAIADLPGMKDEDGAVEEDRLAALVAACGKFVGLLATSEALEGFKTLGDLTAWVASANDAPILLLTWSPNCGSVKRAHDRIVEAVARSQVRVYVVATNARDTDEDYAKFQEAVGDWNVRIFPDREQKVTDILGAAVTPQFYLFDTKGVLRYTGAVDNDAMGYMDDAERKNYLIDAAAAIRAGKDVPVQQTEPSG